jgi:hypothetical protein
MGPWEIPEEIEFTSSVADELLLGCGVAHNVYQCRMIAVYESYFIYFKADVSEGGITLQDVEKMLSGIDDRMEVCLGEE